MLLRNKLKMENGKWKDPGDRNPKASSWESPDGKNITGGGSCPHPDFNHHPYELTSNFLGSLQSLFPNETSLFPVISVTFP